MNHVAVVTGAGGGVGKAIADALEARGMRVARVARSSGTHRADVSRRDEVARLAREVERDLGTPTVLVNAAGIFGPIAKLQDGDPAAWLETIAIDLGGPYLCCHSFLPGMLRAGWGRIVNLSSAATLHTPGAYNSAYGTAKVALNQLTRHLAAELEGTGVTANVIHPGDIKTEMWQDIRRQALGVGADDYLAWVAWVEETGGDPPEKAAALVLRIIDGDANGDFHWIDEPLQAPIPTWSDDPHRGGAW
jgi:NAD(P)-dependent dehydrogenase (short-subunit alcohol dehydrogenase family)